MNFSGKFSLGSFHIRLKYMSQVKDFEEQEKERNGEQQLSAYGFNQNFTIVSSVMESML